MNLTDAIVLFVIVMLFCAAMVSCDVTRPDCPPGSVPVFEGGWHCFVETQ
jgi:hypothetical protein